MKRTLILVSIVVLAVFGSAVLVSLKDIFSSPQAILEKETPQTTLAISPSKLTLSSDTGSVDIRMTTKSNDIRFVQIQLSYDPQTLTNFTLSKGAFFKDAEVLNTFVNHDKGLVTYILNLPKNKKPVKGKGIVAKVSFKTTLVPGQKTIISFSKETLVTNDTYPASLLKNTTGTTIIKE